MLVFQLLLGVTRPRRRGNMQAGKFTHSPNLKERTSQLHTKRELKIKSSNEKRCNLNKILSMFNSL
jgi:hypothetical protein